MARLLVNPGAPAAWEVQLKPGPNIIGRAITNHFQITHPSVSSSHCRIVVGDSSAEIEDLNSTNGTFINGAPVHRALLQDGQKLRLGEVDIVFFSDGEDVVAAGLPGAEPVIAAPGGPAGTATLTATVPVVATSRHCRFHPKTPARFTCNQCHHYFCEACVASRQIGGTQHKSCRHCGTECEPVEVCYEAAVEQGFLERLPGALGYPLRGAGVFVVIVGIVVLGMLKGGQVLIQYGNLRMIIFGVIAEVIAGGYLFTYLQAIVHSSVAEDRGMPDLPGISNPLEDVVLPFFKLLGLALFCFGPALAVAIWITSSHPANSTPLLLGATALGCVYFPMAFLAVAVLDSITAGNPLVVVVSITKVPMEYLVSLLLLGAVGAVQWGGALAMQRLFPEGWTTQSMGQLAGMLAATAFLSFFSLYLLVLAVHVLGLLYVTRKHRLGWIER